MDEKNAPPHYGERFYKASLYVLEKFKIKRYELAASLGNVDNTTIARWIKFPTFKPQQLLKLEGMRKYGVNPLYFKEKNVEMLLPGAELGVEGEVVKAFVETGEAIEEQNKDLKEVVKLLKKLLDGQKKLHEENKEIRDDLNILKKKAGSRR